MADSALLDEFVRLNAAVDRPNRHAADYILVDAAYRDFYIVACTLKIADCVARLQGRSMAVMVAANADPDVMRVVQSFQPAAILPLGKLAGRGMIAAAGAVVAAAARLNTGDKLVRYAVEGRPVGFHLYDTLLMRFGLATIESMSLRHRANLFAELSILHGVRATLADRAPAFAILPDTVYRSGALFQLLAARRIPMLAALDLNGLAAHFYRSDEDYNAHCRKPDADVFERIVSDPVLFAKAEEYLAHRTSGAETQHDVKTAYRADAAFVDRASLSKMMGLTGAKPIVMIASHVLSDAPHACEGLLHQDYQHWLLATCRRLVRNEAVDFFVKEHPSSGLYGQQGLCKQILQSEGFERHLLPAAVNTRSLFNVVDAVITCGGTAGAEFPCFGVPVLLAAGAAYDGLGYVRRARSIVEYEAELDRLQGYQRLTADQVRRARAGLFVIQAGMRVPKAMLGLGSQPLMMGHVIDIDAFLRELIDDLRSGAGYAALRQTLDDLLRGRSMNLIARGLGSEMTNPVTVPS